MRWIGLAAIMAVFLAVGCGKGGDGGPCGQACASIDGKVTRAGGCLEFCTGPIEGVYGDLYCNGSAGNGQSVPVFI